MRNSNLLLKWRDLNPIREVINIGLSCWESPVEFAHIKVGPPLAFPGAVLLDNSLLPPVPPYVVSPPLVMNTSPTPDAVDKHNNVHNEDTQRLRSMSPTLTTATSPSLARSVSPTANPLSPLSSLDR